MLHASIDSTPRGDAGEYRLVSKIGVGGQASVYRADLLDAAGTVFSGRDPCAVKIFHGQISGPADRRKFDTECAALLQLDDAAGVVGLLDHGEVDGHGFIVMPLFATSCAERIASLGRIGAEEVIATGQTVARALSDVHQRGILHLDVKPSNLFVDADGAVVLGDFGTASGRLDHTITGSLVTSVPYAAPELLDRGSTSAATDIYALGATLYEMLTGQPPFMHESDVVDIAGLGSLLRRVETRPPAPIESSAGPAALIALVGEMLDKRPAHRPASAGIVADRLGQIEAGAPARVAAPSAPGTASQRDVAGRDRSRTRRRRVLTTGVVVLVVGIGLTVGLRRGTERSGAVDTAIAATITTESRSPSPVFVDPQSSVKPPPTLLALDDGQRDVPPAAAEPDDPVPRSRTESVATTPGLEPVPAADADPDDTGLGSGRPDAPAPDTAPVPSAEPGSDAAPASAVTVPAGSSADETPGSTAAPRPTVPPGKCGDASVVLCEDFEVSLDDWARRQSGPTTVTRDASVGRANSDGVALRTNESGFGSASLRQPVVVDGEAITVSSWMRFGSAQVDGGYFANVLSLVDERDTLWNVDVRDTDAGITLSLYHQTVDDFTAGGSVDAPIEPDRWYCVGVTIAPSADVPAVLTVDGQAEVQVTEALSTPIGEVYTLTVGSNYISDRGRAPDVFYDDVRVAMGATPSC